MAEKQREEQELFHLQQKVLIGQQQENLQHQTVSSLRVHLDDNYLQSNNKAC